MAFFESVRAFPEPYKLWYLLAVLSIYMMLLVKIPFPLVEQIKDIVWSYVSHRIFHQFQKQLITNCFRALFA